MRLCKKCGTERELDQFPVYVNTTGQRGRRHTCKPCRNAYNYERKMETVYGISKDEYDDMYSACNGECMTCGAKEELVIDHCHSSGKVRGLLCHSCNVAIGHSKDDPEVLRQLIRYLERNQ